MTKIVKKANIFISILMMGIVLAVAIHLVRYGVELTDSTWYCAEPYLVAKGATPYVDNWSQAAGFTFPFYLVIQLFVALSNGTEGIILFCRIFTVAWLLLMSVLVYYLSGKRIREELPFVTILPLVFFAPHNLFYINYNNIGVIYLMVACVAVLNDQEKTRKERWLRGIFSGGIIARGILGTPIIIVPCIILAVIILVQKDYISLKGYILGGVIVAVIVVFFCSIKGGGIDNLKIGLNLFLRDGIYFKIMPANSVKSNILLLFDFLKPCGVCLLLLCSCKLVLYREKKLCEKVVKIILIGFLLVGLVGRTQYYMNMSYMWFEGVLAYIFIVTDREDLKPFAEIIALYFLTYISISYVNISGVHAREYWLFIPGILSCLGLYKVVHFPLIIKKAAIITYMFILSIIMINGMCSKVYRDEPISNLDTIVETGIWKGCYSTKNRVDKVIWLEQTIKNVTEEKDKVLFLDWASFGYLMSKGIAFTPSALDNVPYSYGIDEPQILYDYFEIKGDIPDKIIYVDFEENNNLSIEDNNWKFNEFVNQYYEYSQTREMNGNRIIVYEKNFYY